MKITFADRKFEKLANDDRKLLKAFGKHRAEKIRSRLTQILFAGSLEELRRYTS